MWAKTSEIKPPEGVILDTTDNNGKSQQRMTYRFGMWWTPDGLNQVIKEPLAWKHTNDWG